VSGYELFERPRMVCLAASSYTGVIQTLKNGPVFWPMTLSYGYTT